MNITAIVVDDEIKGALVLKEKITRWTPNVEVKAVCNSAKEALYEIMSHRPDLIFLDIEMPEMNGLEFFRHIKDFRIPLQCIIVSVHGEPEYLKEAIRLGLTDYLVKPVMQEELISAVNNVTHKISQGLHMESMNRMANLLSGNKITLPIVNGVVRVLISEVLYAEANGKFTKLFFHDKRTEQLTIGISEVEKLTDKHGLRRIDRFTLINPELVEKVSVQFNKIYFKGVNGTIELDVSKKGAEEVEAMMKQY